MKIGRQFAPKRVRSFGSTAVVIGRGGVLILDLKNPKKPRVVSQLYARTIGPIEDAAGVSNRIFLLGPRGLLVLGPQLRTVAEAVDVEPGAALAAMGRHLIAVGGSELQVVDASPFTRTLATAKPAARAATASSKRATPASSKRATPARLPADEPADSPRRLKRRFLE